MSNPWVYCKDSDYKWAVNQGPFFFENYKGAYVHNVCLPINQLEYQGFHIFEVQLREACHLVHQLEDWMVSGNLRETHM